MEDSLGDLLELQVVERKEDAPLYNFAEFRADRDEGERLDGAVLQVHHLVYDLDRASPQIDDYELSQLRERLSGRAGVLYSTHRHLTDHPRYRLVLLCDRPILAPEYRGVWRAAVDRYQLPLGDSKSQNESRMFYAPSSSPERVRHAVLEWLEGVPLPVAELVVALPPAVRRLTFGAIARLAQPIQKRPREGSRNEQLFRYACSLRRRGLEDDELLAVVGQRNAALREPLEAEELEQLCRSATRYDPDPALLEAQRKQDERLEGEGAAPLAVGDHVEVARLELAAMGWRELADSPTLVADGGDLYTYDPSRGVWARALPERLRAQVDAYSGRDVQRPGVTKAGEPYAPQPLKVTHQFARGAQATMLDLAHAPGWLAERPPGLAFLDGFVRVSQAGWELWDHDPANRCTHRHPWQFDPDPHTPLWDRFLGDLRFGGEMVSYLHEYLGACLVGDVTRYKTCLVLSGSGDNGKSVLLDVLQACFPPGSVASVRPGDWGRRFVLSSLVGARLNVVDEMPDARITDADVFKAVVSGGRVRGERKYEGAFEFRPACGHLFAANKLPRSLDRTEGFFTRWSVVPLTRTFARREMDHHLTDKLMTEVPAIASRLVIAAGELARRGRLVIPETVQEAREQWRAEGDHALRFARELTSAPGSSTKTDDLYRMFRRWCEQEEQVPRDEVPSLRAFGQALARAGHEPADRDGTQRAWQIKNRPFGGVQ